MSENEQVTALLYASGQLVTKPRSIYLKVKDKVLALTLP
jgi:hypothetical protein